jgi:hypothetical protein
MLQRDKPLQQLSHVSSLQRNGSGHLGSSYSASTPRPTSTSSKQLSSGLLAYVNQTEVFCNVSMLGGSSLHPLSNGNNSACISTSINVPGVHTSVNESLYTLYEGSSQFGLRPVKQILHRSTIACFSDGEFRRCFLLVSYFSSPSPELH